MRLRTRVTALLLAASSALTCCLLTGCDAPRPSRAATPPADRAGAADRADDVIKAATRHLTDACLTRQGLTPPRPGQSPPPADERQRRVSDALFGAGPTELSLSLPTGHVVRAHTDGCLAAAQQRLYGDQARWFRTSVVVNNLEPEAAHTHRDLAEVRARHRAEIADWQRLRAHALSEATALLDRHHHPHDPMGAPPA
ncbi:hypothetical protein [Streptomyces sp. RerS4]|uniref:hypothetical protein n=1 Tax=Streptomyces sp. RerS4 TaxID=2942449 RepID=UPI00201CA5CC|nr:hypothetical protein [Streptomyces sp. RerS4]UQX00677.1 hypothetical protein M4D82_09175 [Streptomyces sp. RerS4]